MSLGQHPAHSGHWPGPLISVLVSSIAQTTAKMTMLKNAVLGNAHPRRYLNASIYSSDLALTLMEVEQSGCRLMHIILILIQCEG